MEYQVFEIIIGELKHEAGRKAIYVAVDRFVQIERFNLIKLSEVSIQHYFLPSDSEYPFSITSSGMITGGDIVLNSWPPSVNRVYETKMQQTLPFHGHDEQSGSASVCGCIIEEHQKQREPEGENIIEGEK